MLKRKENARDYTTNLWQGPSRNTEPFFEEGIEEDDYAVDPRTGWRFCKTSAEKAVAFVAIVLVHQLLHGLTIRAFFLRKDQFRLTGRNFPTTDGVWRQNTHSHDTFVHVQRITERSAQVQSLTTRTRVAQVVCLGVSKVVCHPSVMSHMLPHLPQNTSTQSLSCPISTHSGLDYETLQDPRRSGGVADTLNLHLPHNSYSTAHFQCGDTWLKVKGICVAHFTALIFISCCVRDAAAATHSLTCGVTDRESDEIKVLARGHWVDRDVATPTPTWPTSKQASFRTQRSDPGWEATVICRAPSVRPRLVLCLFMYN